jgi:2-phosphosulfolactate phosphatase
MLSRPPLHVHLLPELIPPEALCGGIAIVVDVLRATTVIVHALSAGCEAVMPCGEIDQARLIERGLPHGTSLLAGERRGLPIEGFDLGNSPNDFTAEICRGKTLIMTTTNGTRAILASLAADRLVISAFVNLRATCDMLYLNLLETNGRPVHIICAGTERRISFEDSLLAGAITARLADWNAPLANDEAEIVLAQWRGASGEMQAGTPLAEILARGRGGQRVTELGLEADMADAARIDRFDLAAELRREPLRIVKAGSPG